MFEDAVLNVLSQIPMVGIIGWVYWWTMKQTLTRIDRMYDIIEKLLDKLNEHGNRS